MEAGAVPARSFDRLREHSIGLPQVLFQSITHMAPAAAVAYSIYISVPHAGPALPLAVAAQKHAIRARRTESASACRENGTEM